MYKKSSSLHTQLSDDNSQKYLPLTKENLKSLNTMEPNEIFKRYWQETPCASPTSYSSSQRERCQSTPANPDVVVASPRLLPFPYHNDSMFLPTAEQLQYRIAHTSSAPPATSSASQADSYYRSDVLISNFSRSSTTNVPSIGHPQTFERRSLPARLDYSFISQKQSSWGRKYGGRLFRTTSSSVSSSDISSLDDDAPITATTSNTNTSTTMNTQPPQRKHWFKRIFKVFSKKKSDIKKDDAGRVWYAEYSKNPSLYLDQQETVLIC